jgi:hypothetical protein
LEPRKKHRTRKVSGRLTKNTVEKDAASSPLYLPNIAELIEQGEITVGVISPVSSVAATAHDGHNTLAMLVRRPGETLVQLLTRLDLAIAKAYNEDVFTDEINPPPTSSKRS